MMAERFIIQTLATDVLLWYKHTEQKLFRLQSLILFSESAVDRNINSVQESNVIPGHSSFKIHPVYTVSVLLKYVFCSLFIPVTSLLVIEKNKNIQNIFMFALHLRALTGLLCLILKLWASGDFFSPYWEKYTARPGWYSWKTYHESKVSYPSISIIIDHVGCDWWLVHSNGGRSYGDKMSKYHNIFD